MTYFYDVLYCRSLLKYGRTSNDEGIRWRVMEVKIKAALTYDSSIPLMGIYSKRTKSTYHRDTCIPVPVIILFTITKLWNQCRCSSKEEWIEKIWCLFTTDYCIKRNEVISFLKNDTIGDNITWTQS